MISRYRNILKWVAVLTAFCVMQIYVFAETTSSSIPTAPSAATSPQLSGTLKTTGNQPVIVNGNSVQPGTTILSGSTIETPAGVGATIQIGSITLDIAPNTEAIVEFTSDGNVKVTLKRGCAILRNRGNVQGTIITPDGTSTQTGEKKFADVCFPLGATSPIVNQGAAANAGAGAGGLGGGAAAAGPGGINRTVLVVLLAGGAGGLAAILLAGGSSNPSPTTP